MVLATALWFDALDMDDEMETLRRQSSLWKIVMGKLRELGSDAVLAIVGWNLR